MRFALLYFTAAVAAALAQAPEPRFDVVSIHVVPPNAPPTMRDMDSTSILPGGRYIDPRETLRNLIAFAYPVQDTERQILGLPSWTKDLSFSISARPAEEFPKLNASENREQVRLMMRAMLIDRFHLQVHSEMREESVFKLEVAKGGFKFVDVNPPIAPAKERYVQLALSDTEGRLIGDKSTMTGLIGAFAIWLKRPVIDQTGLKGHYDFDVKWRTPDVPESSGLTSVGIGLLISTLRDRFGLVLKNDRGLVQYWIVDHVEPPTEN